MRSSNWEGVLVGTVDLLLCPPPQKKIAEGQVGEMRLEQPLLTRTWDDPDGIEQTWVQSSVRPVMYVTNPFSIKKVTGLNG